MNNEQNQNNIIETQSLLQEIQQIFLKNKEKLTNSASIENLQFFLDRTDDVENNHKLSIKERNVCINKIKSIENELNLLLLLSILEIIFSNKNNYKFVYQLKLIRELSSWLQDFFEKNQIINLEKFEELISNQSIENNDLIDSPPQTLLKIFQLITKFLRKVSLRKVTPWIWAFVIILVIIPKIGELFIVKAFQTNIPSTGSNSLGTTTVSSTTISNNSNYQEINWNHIEKEIKKAMSKSHQMAEEYASEKLNEWKSQLIERLDNNFLDWYFGYFNQKQLEYKSFFAGISANINHWLNPKNPEPQEKIAELLTEEFQTEFAKRVLVPQLSQLTLENISNQTVKQYLKQVSINLSQIQLEENIPKADWERYLKETSIEITTLEGEVLNLSLQKLITGGAYVALKPVIVPAIGSISSAIAIKFAGKIGAKIATKTGTIIATKVGSTFLDCTVGVGILLWDIWDTNHTAKIERPILRENLVDYIEQVKESILINPNHGIMSVIDTVDQKIFQAIEIVKSFS